MTAADVKSEAIELVRNQPQKIDGEMLERLQALHVIDGNFSKDALMIVEFAASRGADPALFSQQVHDLEEKFTTAALQRMESSITTKVASTEPDSTNQSKQHAAHRA